MGAVEEKSRHCGPYNAAGCECSSPNDCEYSVAGVSKRESRRLGELELKLSRVEEFGETSGLYSTRGSNVMTEDVTVLTFDENEYERILSDDWLVGFFSGLLVSTTSSGLPNASS